MSLVSVTSLTLLVLVPYLINADKYTAIVELEKTLKLEAKIAKHLRLYIKKETERLTQLQTLANNLARHSKHSLQDPGRYLGNPINAFHVVKMMSIDWEETTIGLINNTNTKDLNSVIGPYIEKLPTYEDLVGSARGILRLQDTYKISTSDLVLGKIPGISTADQMGMSARDCFEIGMVAFDDDKFHLTVEWMQEALGLLDEEDVDSVEEADILQYLSFALYETGDVQQAKDMSKRWLDLKPGDEMAKDNLKLFESVIKDAKEGLTDDASVAAAADDSGSDEADHTKDKDDYSMNESDIYKSLCRGERTAKTPDPSDLRCQYRFWHPMFSISPLREETLHHDPWVAMYHQFATDKEMDELKAMAVPKLERSLIRGGEKSDIRVSKYTVLEPEDSPVVAKLNHRFSALTNLSLETAEVLQVVNYGIGGYYTPHYDFGMNDALVNPLKGHRMLTSLLYMSDVQVGGATVFVKAGVQVLPEKGAVSVWYNLKPSGEKDFSTLHAGCPVLVGSKWIANKWFKERSQEFRRPCLAE